MRRRTETICITLGLALSLAIALLASPSGRAEDKPCLKIKEACEQAGFKFRAVSQGLGLLADCIRPIMDNAPNASASKPLPAVDADIVKACKAKNPDFGKPKLNGQPGPASSGSDY
jgi:hypothetical protein